MSRSFTPPSTLSKDEIRTIADVRRDIWTSAFVGLGTGSLVGVLGHAAAQLGNRRGLWKLPLNRNTAFLSVLLGGATGSFLMAVTTGKNEVHNLHPIFKVGARTPNGSSYEESLQRAKEREEDLRRMELSRRQLTIQDKQAAEREERQRNRLFRRATLQRALEEGHGGLSDSHGGHWVREEDDRK